MRLFEILCIPIYMASILFSLSQITPILVRLHLGSLNLDKVPDTPINQKDCPVENFKEFGGQIFEMMLIEVMVYGFMIATMFFTMVKSRFVGVGMDNSSQFEKIYMGYLVNKIRKKIQEKIKELKAEGNIEIKEHFVDNERVIPCEGI